MCWFCCQMCLVLHVFGVLHAFGAVFETKWFSAVFGFDYLPLKNAGLSTFVVIFDGFDFSRK